VNEPRPIWRDLRFQRRAETKILGDGFDAELSIAVNTFGNSMNNKLTSRRRVKREINATIRSLDNPRIHDLADLLRNSDHVTAFLKEQNIQLGPDLERLLAGI
jgi:hypothetical protein